MTDESAHIAESVRCRACDREVKLVMKPGQPQSTVCLCGLGMTWDGDCHVIWNGGDERRIKATLNDGSDDANRR